MLVEMRSPAFKIKGQERPPIRFKEGLNVVLGQEDGAMSLGKSSTLLAIDFVFGGMTYVKSDGVKQEGHHTVYFKLRFDGLEYCFARSTGDPGQVQLCDQNYNLIGQQYTLDKYTSWLKQQYGMDFPELSFRVALSSYFRIYGKGNTDEINPLRGIPGQNMDKSVTSILTLFNRYKDIKEFKDSVTQQKERLEAYKNARKYDFISNLVGGQEKYKENLEKIKSLELQLATLMEEAEKGHTEEEIELNKQKAALTNDRLAVETAIATKERRLRLVGMNLEYGLYPTDADMSALQEFFPTVNLRKLYEVERYHQKLAKLLNSQFTDEKQTLEAELETLQGQRREINEQINQLGFVGNISREFLDRHSAIKGEIDALRSQNNAYLKQKALQDAKNNADAVLRHSTEDILYDIEVTLNAQMKEFNDTLFMTKKKPPHLHFNSYNSYTFDTPDNTGTGSNYKGMLVYDLAVLYCTALPAIAHDSLLFKNLGKDAEDGIIRIYNKTKKQIFIAYDKQGDCRQQTREILERNCVLRLSTDGCELYGRSWDTEESEQ